MDRRRNKLATATLAGAVPVQANLEGAEHWKAALQLWSPGCFQPEPVAL